MPEDFYSIAPEPSLRFGDVVSGFPALQAHLDTKEGVVRSTYSIAVSHPAYAVVMNPCCSIRDGILALCPMKSLGKGYFRADRLKENPLLLNEKMLAKDAMPRQQWDRLSLEEKAEKESNGVAYVFNAAFVLAPHPLLPVIEIEIAGRRERIGHYEIDFRDICSIRSKDIEEPEKPVKSVTKVLQLTDACRALLRDKLQFYFQRIGVGA